MFYITVLYRLFYLLVLKQQIYEKCNTTVTEYPYLSGPAHWVVNIYLAWERGPIVYPNVLLYILSSV